MKFIQLLISICIIIVLIVLQGCVSAVIISAAAVATKTTVDPRSIGTQFDDSVLEAKISNEISKNQQLKKEARIINTVYQSKVLLTGQAPTIALLQHAKQIAMSVNGVTDVYNEIRLERPISMKRISMDALITAQICSQLLANHMINSFNIKVTTENGEVFLLGKVTNEEGKEAAKLASKVKGVKHVITAFTYLYN